MSDAPAWVDGSFSGRIDPRDRGLTLGDGVFDTLAAFRRIPFAGDRHLERLTGQAAAVGIPLDPATVRAGWDAVLGGPEIAALGEHLILRTTVTRGVGARGLWPATAPAPTVIVSATPWDPASAGRAVRLVVSSFRRNPASPSSRLKTLGYLDNILAAREAIERGADDALFLTPGGRVACSTIANVFALHGARLTTPPLDDGVQPGILRALVLASAESLGLVPAERPLTLPDLRAADAVFLTNSVRLLSPAVELDNQPLAPAATTLAALMRAISQAILRECGYDPRAGG